jgi:DNA repair exonuclease SbcCD ATPase subunit
MKRIELKCLSLRNFKGFEFTLEAGGEDLSVSGANATGKTTLADAWHWLLFDKDSSNRSDFGILPLQTSGEDEHNVDACVEAAILIDGIVTTLCKTYKEVYSRKRGSAESLFTGHTSEYAINGVPVKLADYKAQVTEIAGDEAIFRLLTSPTAFPALPWTKQRSLLLDCCGDYTDAQVIESDSALAPLTDLLKRYTVSKTPVDDLKKVVTGRRSEINKQIDALPVRIDEVRRGLPDIADLDQTACTINVQTHESNLNAAKLRLQGVDNGSSIAPLSKKLEGIKDDIRRLEQDHYNATAIRLNKLNADIRKITEAAEAVKRQRTNIDSDIVSKAKRLEDIDADLKKLRAKWAGIDAEEFQGLNDVGEVSETCPTCGAPLAQSKIEAALETLKAAKEKVLANFNRDKSERLETITRDGKRLAADRNRIEGEINGLNRAMAELEDKDTSALEELTAERDALKTAAEDYTLIPGYEELTAQQAATEEEIRAAREGVQGDKGKIEAEIQEHEAALKEAREKAQRFVNREQGEKRIEELKADEKKLAKEFAELERQLFLVENFIKRKVGLLTDRINGEFHLVKWKLYEIQVNQGVSECCVAMVNGVSYDAGLNSAARTQAGCDIVNTLQEHFQLSAPVWIDNRESCTVIPEMKCQTISLYVSPQDKTLRVETKSNDTLFGHKTA